MGCFGHRALKCTLSRSSAWELRSEVPGWNEGARELQQGWVVPLASTKGGPGGSAQGSEASGSEQETAQAAPRFAGKSGLRDSTARKAVQVKVRSNFHAKDVETVKSSKLALAEELATLGDCGPIYSLTEVTLLTVAGALDSAGYRSASSYIAELRLQHIELDFAISPALKRAFKEVIDAVTRGFGPVKKAPEVKLSAIQQNTDTMIVGSADAYVISLHWLLRAGETEGLSSGMASLILHEEVSGPGDVTLRLPTSKTDQRGNGAFVSWPLRWATRCPTPARLCGSPSDFSFALVV